MSKRAFTFMELLVVIIIISVLASIALPRFTLQMKKIHSQEAQRILYSLYAAQKDYLRENGAYATNLNDVDVEVSNIKHFGNPSLSNGTATTACVPLGFIVAMVHTDGTFSLSLDAAGDLTCTDCSGGTICVQMGF